MDLLSDILAQMRLTGTLYFRTSFTSPWGVKVPPFENVARFHFVHHGRCLARIHNVTQPVGLNQGDLIIITRGAAHTLYCDPVSESMALPLEQMLEDTGFSGHGTLVYGEQGTHHETQLVCGHFSFDSQTTHPLIEALPAYIHLPNYGEGAGAWTEQTLRVIGAEAGRDQPGGDLIAMKMSEIIFAQAVRAYLQRDGAGDPQLAGFADPKIARALNAVHEDPAQSWSVEAMAHIAGMSRTSFANRFVERLGMTPLAYLTNWRMQLARDALERTGLPIIDIAEQSGYGSEAAFGRVFKKHFGQAPATYRRQRASEMELTQG